MDYSGYKVIGHVREQVCPRCKKPAFCEDCGLCEACKFIAPDVDQPYPATSFKVSCDACGNTQQHTRTCPLTQKAAAN